MDVLTQLIGPNVQLHHTKMLVKPPEQGAPFPMHQDYPYFPHTRHSVLAASVHLDDTNEENGCLRVIAGLAQARPARGAGREQHARVPLEDGEPIPARAGDVLLFSYLTIHGSGVNASDAARRNVLFQYRDPADEPVLARRRRGARRLGPGDDGRRAEPVLLGAAPEVRGQARVMGGARAGRDFPEPFG